MNKWLSKWTSQAPKEVSNFDGENLHCKNCQQQFSREEFAELELVLLYSALRAHNSMMTEKYDALREKAKAMKEELYGTI